MLDYDPSREALYSPARRPTLFERGKTYDAMQLAVEAARLAYVRAESSAAERARLTDALDRVGFDPPTLFVDGPTGTEAFGAHRTADRTTLVAFRGTAPDAFTDLLTDANALPTEWHESAGRVHRGFAAAMRAVLPGLRPWVEQQAGDGLIIAGHSLGGALATLAATVLRPTFVVTLGAPRVGDAVFAATVPAAVVRLVGCCDAVTDLPPPVGYVHPPAWTYLTRDARHVRNPAPVLVRGDRLRARVHYLARHAWTKGAVLVRDLADHSPINYARSFFP